MNWIFTVREMFQPRSHENKSVVVLAGTILSGGQDDPIGRQVRILIDGLEAGQGTIISRYRFDKSLPDQSAYIYEGSPINREDIDNNVVLELKILK
jgi:hypothetical protein